MRQRLAAAVIGIVLTISACARTEIHSRLVGKWEEIPDEEFKEKTMAWVREHYAGKQVQDHQPQATSRAVPADSESIGSFSYFADGTTVMTGSILGHDFEHTDRWSLVEDKADRITIDVIDQGPNHLGEKWRRTFVFEGPDLIREEDPKMGKMKYRRVK